MATWGSLICVHTPDGKEKRYIRVLNTLQIQHELHLLYNPGISHAGSHVHALLSHECEINVCVWVGGGVVHLAGFDGFSLYCSVAQWAPSPCENLLISVRERAGVCSLQQTSCLAQQRAEQPSRCTDRATTCKPSAVRNKDFRLYCPLWEICLNPGDSFGGPRSSSLFAELHTSVLIHYIKWSCVH